MRSKIDILILIFFTALLYVLTVRGLTGNFNNAKELSKFAVYNTTKFTEDLHGNFESSHERSTYAFMLSLRNKSIALSKDLADFGIPDIGFFKGNLYSLFPPGLALTILPMYIIGGYFNLGQVFSYFSIAFFAIGSALLLYKVSRNVFKLPSWVSIFSALIFSFATTSWSYAITIYQHLPAAFFILFGFYAVWKFKKAEKYRFFWASLVWFIYGLSIFFDYPNAILMLPIIIYFFVSSVDFEPEPVRRININGLFFITSIVFIALLALHGLYNNEVFGRPIKFHNTLPVYNGFNYEELINGTSRDSNKPTIWRIFTEEAILQGINKLFIRADRGLFIYSPILLFALLGMFSFRKKYNVESITLLITVAVNILVYTSTGIPEGGRAFGPRYLIPSMSVLSLFVAIWLLETKYKMSSRILIFIVVTFSSGVALLGALTTNMNRIKEEAINLNKKYTFLFNWDFLKQGKSGSFVYNEFLADKISLVEYFFIIYGMLLTVFAVVLFVLPMFEKEKERVEVPPAPTVPSELAVGDPSTRLGVNKKIPVVPAKERAKKLRVRSI